MPRLGREWNVQPAKRSVPNIRRGRPELQRFRATANNSKRENQHKDRPNWSRSQMKFSDFESKVPVRLNLGRLGAATITAAQGICWQAGLSGDLSNCINDTISHEWSEFYTAVHGYTAATVAQLSTWVASKLGPADFSPFSSMKTLSIPISLLARIRIGCPLPGIAQILPDSLESLDVTILLDISLSWPGMLWSLLFTGTPAPWAEGRTFIIDLCQRMKGLTSSLPHC